MIVRLMEVYLHVWVNILTSHLFPVSTKTLWSKTMSTGT